MCTTILSGIVGSRAYGLEHAASDTDRLAVHVRPTVDFLGIRVPQMSEVHQGPAGDDTSSHELGKYLSMVLACNPTASELLWLPTDLYETVTTWGTELIAQRDGFLFAKGVRNSYLGYAHAQAKRCRRDFATDGRREKAARHTYRLVKAGVGLWRTGKLDLVVADREECFEFGRQVADGNTDLLDQLLSSAEEEFAKPTALPSSNSEAREAADLWLRRVRLDQLT